MRISELSYDTKFLFCAFIGKNIEVLRGEVDEELLSQ